MYVCLFLDCCAQNRCSPLLIVYAFNFLCRYCNYHTVFCRIYIYASKITQLRIIFCILLHVQNIVSQISLHQIRKCHYIRIYHCRFINEMKKLVEHFHSQIMLFTLCAEIISLKYLVQFGVLNFVFLAKRHVYSTCKEWFVYSKTLLGYTCETFLQRGIYCVSCSLL